MQPENLLHTVEIPLEDGYGMIDEIINNGRHGGNWRGPRPRRTESCRRKALHLGAARGRKAGVRGAEITGQTYPAEEALGTGRLASRSKKWRLEWAFFLGRER